MPQVRVVGSRTPPGRCAYCHAALDFLPSTCAGCGTSLHAECLAEHGGCPTPGCHGPLPPAPPDPSTPLPPPGRPPIHEHLAWAARRRSAPGTRHSLLTRAAILINLSGAWIGALLLSLLCLPLAAATAGTATYLVVTGAIHDVPLAGILAFLCALVTPVWVGFGWQAVRRLWRNTRTWTRLRGLLGHAEPAPRTLRIYRHGRERATYAALYRLGEDTPVPGLERIRVDGTLPARWLYAAREHEPVLVYFAKTEAPPLLIEDRTGQLSLLDP